MTWSWPPGFARPICPYPVSLTRQNWPESPESSSKGPYSPTKSPILIPNIEAKAPSDAEASKGAPRDYCLLPCRRFLQGDSSASRWAGFHPKRTRSFFFSNDLRTHGSHPLDFSLEVTNNDMRMWLFHWHLFFTRREPSPPC